MIFPCGEPNLTVGGQVLLDEHVPSHGHRVGLRLGWVSVVGLPPSLAEGDPRLNHVAPWAQQRLCTREACTRVASAPVGRRGGRAGLHPIVSYTQLLSDPEMGLRYWQWASFWS
jgi:hypothetical protein